MLKKSDVWLEQACEVIWGQYQVISWTLQYYAIPNTTSPSQKRQSGDLSWERTRRREQQPRPVLVEGSRRFASSRARIWSLSCVRTACKVADDGKMVTVGAVWRPEMTSSVGDCHYYELGNYITVCKPGQDHRRKEAGLGTIDISARPSRRYMAYESIDIFALPACHGR
jgi:hypothetical protein